MAKYILKRLIAAVISMFFLITVTFFLMHAIPGGPFSAGEQKDLNPEILVAIRARYGLDKPVFQQYLNYLGKLVQGDMGVSFKMQKNRPVVDIIKEKFPVSAKVGFFALLWAIIVGVPLGCIAAYKRGTWVDSLLRVICTIGVSIPSFVIASLLIERFAGANASTRIFPTIFDASLGAKSYVMPAFALGLYPMCYTARQARSSMLDALGQDYIKTARAKGLTTNRIIFKHALRNALIPVITFLGPEIAFVFCGGFVIEKVFSIPGLGRYFVQSILARDYPVIMGTTIFLASFIILMNLVVDILYHVVDPRIELAGGEN